MADKQKYVLNEFLDESGLSFNEVDFSELNLDESLFEKSGFEE